MKLRALCAKALFLSSTLTAGLSWAHDGNAMQCVTDAEVQILVQHRFAEFADTMAGKLAKLPDPDIAPDSPKIAELRQCLTSQLAGSWKQSGRMADAKALQVANIERVSRVLPPGHPSVLNARFHLASILGASGEYDKAIPVLRELLPLYAKTFGSESLELETVLMNLATALSWVGNFKDALPHDEHRLRIVTQFQPGRQCPTQQICRLILGRTHTHLAETLRRLDRNSEAEAHVLAGLTLMEETSGKTHPNTLDTRLVLASIRLNQGHIAEANRIEREVYETALRIHGPRHAVTLKAQGNLSVSTSRLGRNVDAATMHEERLALLRAERGAGHPDTLLAIQNLAVTYSRQGRSVHAREMFRSGVIELLRRRDTLEFDDRSLQAWETWFSGLVDGYLRELLQQEQIANAFLLTEQFKARWLSLRLGLRGSLAGVDAEAANRQRALRGELAKMDQAIALARSLGRDWTAEEAQRARSFQALREIEAREPEQLAEAQAQPRWASTLFLAGPVVLSYRFHRGHLIAFVVRADRQQVFTLDSHDVVRKSVEAYRQTMRHLGTQASSRVTRSLPLWIIESEELVFSETQPAQARRAVSLDEALKILSARLLRPLEEHISAQERLLISVDGNLGNVPFEALPYKGSTLGEHHAVSLLPTFAVLAMLNQRSEAYRRSVREPLLAIGGAAYSRMEVISPFIRVQREAVQSVTGMDLKAAAQAARSQKLPFAMALGAVQMGFPDLPGTDDEITRISRILAAGQRTEPTLLRRSRASESSWNELASQDRLKEFRFIHFAAHGFLSDDEPLLSSIVLSQVLKEPGTDGYLTVPELASVKLAADLVVVSACDSGVSQVANGNGQAGLATALFEAGSQAALLSLWPVPDRETPLFMEHFYGHVARGVAPVQALNLTKQWARGQGMSRHVVDGFVYWGI